MRKISKLLIVCVFATIISCSLLGCNGGKQDQGENPPAGSSTQVELSLRKSSVSMLLGDTVKIEAIYNEIDGETIVYKSDNENIAKVSSNGIVEAMGVGSTQITVSYAGESETCSITVDAGNMMPVLSFEEEIDEAITIFLSGRLNLGVLAFYNGKYFDDVNVSCEFSDETIGYVDENGVFVPQKAGQTNVTLKGNWRGLSGVLMEKTVDITVKAGTFVNINDGQSEFELYTVSSFYGKTYQTSMGFVVSLMDDDGITTIPDVKIEVKEGADILNYENDTISSKGKNGTAVIAISAEDEIHGKIYHEVKVKILRPVAISSYVGNIDANDGTLDLDAMEQIFGKSDTKVCDVESETLDLTVEDGKIFGFTTEGTEEPEVQTITVYNDEVGYTIGVKAYAGVIRTVADFAKLITSTTANTKVQETADNVNTLTGYYILGNDIDASGETFEKTGYNITGRSTKEFANVGFRGVFDGKGHTVSNMTTPRFGIFGMVGKGAVIRNVAFTDIVSDGYADATLAGYICGAKIENVYISVKEIKVSQSAVVAVNVGADCILNNCVFEAKSFTKPSSASTAYGVMGYMLNGKAVELPTQWTNTFIIAPFETIYAGNYGYTVDAAYIDGVATNKETGNGYYSLSGIKRYTSWNAFIGDAVNNQNVVSGFDSAYWDTSCGVPVWGETLKISAVKIGNVVVNDTQDLNLGKGGEITVVATGVGETSCTVTLVSGNSVSILNGVVTAIDLGQSIVKVSYVYEGATVERTITLNVVKPETNAYVTVNGEIRTSITLMPGEFAAIELVGAKVNELEVVSGEGIIEIEDTTVKAIMGGLAVVRVKWTEGEFDFYDDINILSVPEEEDKTTLTVNFDVSKGVFDSEDLTAIFGANETNTQIVSATLNGTELTVANGVISGIKVGTSGVVSGELCIVTTTRCVKFNIKAYSRIFKTADDLFYLSSDGTYYSYFDMYDANRWETASTSKPKITGAYLLANDIDLTNDTRVMGHRALSYYRSNYKNYDATISGFVGLFEGGGHTITGMTVGKGGIFGAIGEGRIQNLSLKDVKFSQNEKANNSFVFAEYICGYSTTRRATLKNIFVSISQGQQTYSATTPDGKNTWVDSGMLAYRTSEYVVYENMVVDFSQLAEINVVGRGVFAFGSGADFNNSKNVFVISSAPLIMSYGGTNDAGRYAVVVDAYNKNDVDWTGTQWAWIYGASIKGYNYGMLTVDTSRNAYMKQDAVYRFDNTAEMKSYIENNNVDLTGFASAYWDTSSGVPVWK